MVSSAASDPRADGGPGEGGLAPAGVLSRRSQARRAELLDALRDLFLAEGFLSFGIGDLAGRLRCSRSTLYLVAPSKEQVIVAVVRWYFRAATTRIESRVSACPDLGERLAVYLDAVAEELQPASAQFYADLARFAPAGEVYAANTAHAARRVRELVAQGVAAGVTRPVDAQFVGLAVAQVMVAIQEGRVEQGAGVAAPEAYRRLSDLVRLGLVPR